jgi:DNA-binding Lrp family transcriptional regulator
MQFRLPRFKRATEVAAMQLTERDREIIRLVHRHRFLRSHQIVALMGGSPQQILRRLKLLYHHGYLERPRTQLDYYHHGGSRHIVYGLGNKSGVLLDQELGATFRQVSWGEKNRAIGRMFLEHALLVSDVMVTIELACRKNGRIRLICGDQIRPKPFRWKVNMRGGLKLGVIPDRVFALEYLDQSGQNQRAYFFLEADRGTMPVVRRTLSQTSFRRKLLAYEATWTQNLHRTRFGIYRFRVLTVTTSVARVKSLVEACSQLKRGHGLFLFADRTILDKPSDIFAPLWQTGRPGETASLLN